MQPTCCTASCAPLPARSPPTISPKWAPLALTRIPAPPASTTPEQSPDSTSIAVAYLSLSCAPLPALSPPSTSPPPPRPLLRPLIRREPSSVTTLTPAPTAGDTCAPPPALSPPSTPPVQARRKAPVRLSTASIVRKQPWVSISNRAARSTLFCGPNNPRLRISWDTRLTVEEFQLFRQH